MDHHNRDVRFVPKAEKDRYRQPAGAIAETTAFNENGVSCAELIHVVPAEAGTWD